MLFRPNKPICVTDWPDSASRWAIQKVVENLNLAAKPILPIYGLYWDFIPKVIIEGFPIRPRRGRLRTLYYKLDNTFYAKFADFFGHRWKKNFWGQGVGGIGPSLKMGPKMGQNRPKWPKMPYFGLYSESPVDLYGIWGFRHESASKTTSIGAFWNF